MLNTTISFKDPEKLNVKLVLECSLAELKSLAQQLPPSNVLCAAVMKAAMQAEKELVAKVEYTG